MPNTRVELPRDHWVEVRDPWEITEKEVLELTADLIRRTSKNAPNPTPGVPGAAGDPLEEFRSRTEGVHHLVASLVVAWGGPLLDGKERDPETIGDLPAPLIRAIDEALAPVMRELFPTGA